MTAAEYRDLLDRLGLTQVKAARLLGVNDRTSRRWATGEQDITPPAARFLRYLEALEVPLNDEFIAWLEAREPRRPD